MLVALAASAQVTIDIDASDRGPKISPTHYGIFFEDINHAADGGIYAELIRNRSFEDGEGYGKPATMQAWKTESAMGASVKAQLIQPSKKQKLLNAAQGNALELQVNASPGSPVCLVNEGFWGINAVQGRTYRLSFFARGNYKGGIKAMLCSGNTVYAETTVEATIGKQWTKYTATLTSQASDPKSQFALVFDGKGTIALDVVSLFPPTFKNRENGLRPDLAQMLYEMHPKFMRFPGGCFVEGQISPDNAFRWERTIGPIEQRPGHWNVNWGYRTTDGIGFHEYLQMAEDLGAKPLYVVNVGLWHGGLTPVDSIQPWIDECLAALEYANGDVTTKYGAMRARNGHPAPFNIEYLEIGNENNQPDPRSQSDHYYERYDKFRRAILEKYPNMQLIGNVVAWGDDNPKWGSQLPVDLLDEHYYRNPSWFADAFHKYDTYDRRGPKIYVGEYAVTSGFGDLGNMNAALGEAVYMMGMENNSDMVPLNSYAPIFVNENDAKWRPDMIRFNSSRVMGTPSYYVQMLMPKYLGTQVVKVNQQYPSEQQVKARTAVTPRESRIGFATWATKASFTHPDPLPKTGQPEFLTGQWQKNDDGTVSQTSMQEQCVAMCNATVGDHYTMKFRARKDGGNEGFMVVFNYTDPQHYCWVNLGGWGNTQHGIERISGGGKSQIATKRGKVETGRWYDITLQMAGDSVKCWLDDDLVFDTVLKGDVTPGVFSSATIDDSAGELIVKVVNTQDKGTTARLNVSKFPVRSAQVIRLSANDGMDENTLEHPTLIHPTTHELSPEGNSLEVEIPANSLNIIRIMRPSFGMATDEPMVHDPVMAYENGNYYIFSTGNGIQQMTSKDRKTWTVSREPVMSVIPKWTHDSVPGFRHHVWAPDIIQWHGRWWMAYSCSTFGKNGSAIGLLSTRSLNRPMWSDEGCIVTSRENRDNWNAIDPNFVIDGNDNPWLVWGSFWDGIQMARLDSTMHIAAGEKPRTIARRHDPSFKNADPNPTSKYAGRNAIEAPFILKHGDYYYLFVSWDYCCQGKKSNYRVAVGRSKNVAGPYLDQEGKDMLYGGGTLVFEGDKQQYEAAGHCAAYHIDGQDIFICHGYSVAHDGAALLIQRPIKWTDDEWPKLF
jgi:alpha-L-arabinofuranosidase